MTDLSKLGKIAATTRFFLGSVLQSVAARDALSDEVLASRLGCSAENLARLRLCRAPSYDGPKFIDEIRRIAEYCSVDFPSLLALVKDSYISESISDASSPESSSGWLMAARDREQQDD